MGVLGVRSVLLLSRSGRGAPGVGEFEAALVGLGARVVIEACDVSDREQLQAVLGLVPEEFPLRGVIHLAGVVDAGVVGGLNMERVERVLAPKLDAAWYLHELTAEMDLSAFVLFSSAAGVLGEAGQGSYAAGNVFLDALAWYRRARGLAGLSIAWGLWALDGLGGTLSEDDIARVERSGVGMFSAEEGLERFDAACRSGRAMLVPVRLQMSALRAQARAGVLPGLLRGLVRVPTQRAGEHAGGSLSRRLAGVGEAEREGVVLEAVRGEVAAVLGLTSAEEVAPGRSFSELGFTSLSAVELRNRLNAATGLRLPATLIFDHPTPTTLATHLNTQLTGVSGIQAGDAALQGAPFAVSGAPEEMLTAIFRAARDGGRLAEFTEMLMGLATLRPSFEDVLEFEGGARVARPARLAQGPGTRLICFPSLVAMTGPHQYVRFAKSFQEAREVSALALPGFHTGEKVPATAEVAVQALALEVKRCAAEGPFAIVGYSSGGILAYAVAEHLLGAGLVPEAVVLIDPYLFEPHAIAEHLAGFIAHVSSREGADALVSDAWLTGLAAYLRLFTGWTPTKIDAPSALVRPLDAMLGGQDVGEHVSPWSCVDGLLDVAGDHFTMMEEHAESTARAVAEWLLSLDADPVAVGG